MSPPCRADHEVPIYQIKRMSVTNNIAATAGVWLISMLLEIFAFLELSAVLVYAGLLLWGTSKDQWRR